MANSGSEEVITANQPPHGSPPKAMSKQMGIYYSNCAMAATSPRDVSLFFGRYVPHTTEKGEQTLLELYEYQIYMTIEQAEDLARILSQTVEATKARKKGEPQRS